ncbi:MAG TPA: peptidoglycan-binding domain-containing protein [Patescibacteria group bacterium]
MSRFLKINAFIGLIVLFFGMVPLSLAQNNPNAIVEGAVRFYFADVPAMADIARCETGFRQYNPDGSALHDASGTYVGIFQISERIHTAKAKSLGFDISTIDGNLGYARYLYNSSGTGPWKGCLPAIPANLPKNTIQVPSPSAIPPAPRGSITLNLRMGMSSSQVLLVQQILNRNGFVIVQAGPGSPGNETIFFGSLTREAVKRFQCAKQIVCGGDEATTGYGRLGFRTRKVLNQL